MTAFEEMAMSAQARIEQPLHPVTGGATAAESRPSARTPLSVVPAPLPRSGPGVTVFAVLVLLASLAAVLVMNIAVSNRQYDLLSLRQEQKAVTETNERLAERVGQLEAPQNLAARAGALGMVTPAGTAAVDVSTGQFSGEAAGARQATLSATYVAPPASETTPPAAAPEGGSIEGPHTAQASPAPAPASASPAPAGEGAIPAPTTGPGSAAPAGPVAP